MAQLTIEEMEYLQQFERHFTTATESKWTRYPGKEGILRMTQVLNRIKKRDARPNYTCNICIVELVAEVGKIYFADKAERAKEIDPSKLSASKKSATEVSASRKSKGQRSKTASKTE